MTRLPVLKAQHVILSLQRIGFSAVRQRGATSVWRIPMVVW